MGDDENLAYGEYHDRRGNDQSQQENQEGERGLFGDTFGRLKNKDEGLSSFFNKVHGVVHGLGGEVTGRISGQKQDGPSAANQSTSTTGSQNRYMSFANVRQSNDVKWYVDGCAYMWAVSVALERARESIWILDCKLHPLQKGDFARLEPFGLKVLSRLGRKPIRPIPTPSTSHLSAMDNPNWQPP